MNQRLFIIAFGVVLLIGSGGIFLGTRSIPAPAHTIEKVIPNDRLFK